MTTDDVFQEWINQQDWIKWKDPKSVRKAFILWGDHVKDKYAEFKKENDTVILDKIKQLMEDKQSQATYNSNGIVWTMPSQSINISVAELNKIIHNE